MALLSSRCTSCGAVLKKKIGAGAVCEYCGTAYYQKLSRQTRRAIMQKQVPQVFNVKTVTGSVLGLLAIAVSILVAVSIVFGVLAVLMAVFGIVLVSRERRECNPQSREAVKAGYGASITGLIFAAGFLFIRIAVDL